MKGRVRWSHVTIALALIAAVAIAAPAIGEQGATTTMSKKTLKKLVKKEVAKQIGKATGPAGANGADGTARAYARVDPSCEGGPLPQVCPVGHAKGVTGATRVATGRYCVTAPGINPNTVAPAVTVYWASTIGPEGNTSAMAAGGGCPGGDFPVNTERHGALTDADYANDVGFTIVIP